MSFQTTIHIEGLLARVAKADQAKLRFASKVLQDSNRHVPVDTGALKGSGHVEPPAKVVWDEHYAPYVYNMDHVISAGNPQGAPHWFEVAKAEKLDQWKDFAKKCLGSGSVSFEVSAGEE